MAIDPQRKQLKTGERMSIEEYFQLDSTHPNEKYEYQDGLIRSMSGGSGEHDAIAFNMRTALHLHFQTSPCFASGFDMRVHVSEKSYYFPDVTVSCDVADRRRGNALIRSPRIVVEVLSPSTEKFDRADKMKKYQSCLSIQEIVLISQFAPYVQVFRKSEQKGASWSNSIYGPGETVAFDSLDIRIPIEEIYQDIDFDEPLLEA